VRPPTLMFGIPVDDVTMDETLDLIEQLVRDGRQHGRTHQISTVNVDFLVNALRDDSVKRLLQRADVCIADGMPVVWGARLAGMPVTERVAGADLLPALVARSVDSGLRIHCFGSAPAVAARALELFQTRYPGASVTTDSGPMMKDVTTVDDAVLAEIAALDPDVLCVALGNPKQERFIAAHRHRLGTPVLIGVGGSLDMLVGDKKRAPKWVQRAGLEWVVRALQEPKRLGKRYAVDAFVFGPKLIGHLWRVRRYRQSARLALSQRDDVVCIGASDASATPASWPDAAGAIERGASLRIDLGGTATAHPASIADLVGLVRVATRCGRPVEFLTISSSVLDELEVLGVDLDDLP
jgi:N-acetylglucosaminyldiphosphoundecaprenol N-acetyl-beta-D-mannosaminyltransferase